jgi:homoserine kinase
MVPGFASVKKAALDRGALGASLSGAGPSVFAWCDGENAATKIAQAMREAFAAAGLDSDMWISPVAGPAAEVTACAT